jgi:hypothetical protein
VLRGHARALRYPGAVRVGGAALQAFAGHQGESAGPGSPKHGRQPEQPATLIYPEESAEKGHARRWRKWLKTDNIDRLIKGVTELADARGKKKEDILKALECFKKNRDRMLYASFRKKGYFVGSGVVEAG